MVDRDKDAGVDDARLSALRETVPRDRMSTTNEDIAEETRVAHKYSKVRALDPLFSAFLAAVMKRVQLYGPGTQRSIKRLRPRWHRARQARGGDDDGRRRPTGAPRPRAPAPPPPAPRAPAPAAMARQRAPPAATRSGGGTVR